MVVPNLLGVLIFLPLVGTEAVVGIFYPNMTGDIIPVNSSSYGGTKFCSFGHNPLIWGFDFRNRKYYSVSTVAVVSFWYSYLYFLLLFGKTKIAVVEDSWWTFLIHNLANHWREIFRMPEGRLFLLFLLRKKSVQRYFEFQHECPAVTYY